MKTDAHMESIYAEKSSRHEAVSSGVASLFCAWGKPATPFVLDGDLHFDDYLDATDENFNSIHRLPSGALLHPVETFRCSLPRFSGNRKA